MPRKKLTEKEKAERKALAEAKKAAELEQAEKLKKRKTILDEVIAIAILALGVFLVLSMFTVSTGVVGAGVKNGLTIAFGTAAYVMPIFFILYGIMVFAQKTSYLTFKTLICVVVFFIFLATLLDQFTKLDGGWVGNNLNGLINAGLGPTGLWIICIVGIIVTLLFLIDTPLSELFDNLKFKARARAQVKEEQIQKKLEEEALRKAEEEKKLQDEAALKTTEEPKHPVTVDVSQIMPSEEPKKPADTVMPALDLDAVARFAEEEKDLYDEVDAISAELGNGDYESFLEDQFTENQKKILTYVTDDSLFGTSEKKAGKGLEEPNHKITAADVAQVQEQVSEDIKKAIKKPVRYTFPPLDLLKKGSNSKASGDSDLEDMSELLENTLESFGVQAKVVDVTKGPAVTRFEVQPAPGVKVSKISSLQNDLALNLRAKSLRIEAPIPGKAAVGIEVSNESISVVTLREILESKAFKTHKSKIAAAVGKSIAGEAVICDIGAMPHMLIAGSTGSGKSVCINSFLLSLLYRATPDEVKLILIDPKVVELSVYNGLPHLLIPVVTEPAKASAALGWAVAEMNERYNKFAEVEVRDLSGYNDFVKANGESEKVMPQVVIVIDELHDLMLSAKNTVEDNISRLAAKARAAGMHLIVATQRPSVDVITGVIKNNIPSRIAFAVGNQMDSRTILDEGGAEHLLGKGDMLYAPQGISKPVRVQGCLVTDNEVKSVIDWVKKSNSEGVYNENVIQAISKAVPQGGNSDSADEEDDMLRDAIECVVRAGECSVSMLQRRFRIGYNHAARLVEIMEEKGIIGPADGARKRKVNMSLDEFMAMDAENSDVPEEID